MSGRRLQRMLLLAAASLLIAADDAPLPFADLDVRPVTESSAQPFDILMDLQKAHSAKTPQQRAALYRSVLSHDPALEQARLGLGEALLDLGDFDAAQEALRGAGGSQAAQTARLLVQIERGERPDVETVLSNRFAHHADARLMNTLGRWLDTQSRGADARKAFWRARPLQRPGLAEANIASSFAREGQLAASVLNWQKAVMLDPQDARFDRQLRMSLLAQGDYLRALDGVSGPASIALLHHAGEHAGRSGELELARLLLERAADLDPRHNPARTALLQQLKHETPDKAEYAER